MKDKKGLYIVIEGVDGAGKDTQEEFLKQILPADTVYTREPRGTEMGMVLREMITEGDLDPMTEVLLFNAARKELLVNVVEPALREGKTVVSNRNELTTYAYQVYARERHDLKPLVDTLSREVMDGLVPDLCIFFDIPAEVRKERLGNREGENNTFDTYAEEFFNRAREGYLQEIKKWPHVIIDASKTIEEVRDDCLAQVKAKLDI